jgi:hypothetical protein
MPSLNMNNRPCPLTEEVINTNVKETIGNYAIGVLYKETFAVKYVGRSDTNLNQRLKDYIGKEGYTHFMFSYAVNTIQAYEKECRNYHDFIDAGFRLDNKIHPDKPENHPDWLKCPRCNL